MRPWFQLPSAKACGWELPRGQSADPSPEDSTAIIGAGLAGLCTARAILKKGFAVTVYEAAPDCAAGASASPAGIVKPYITRQPSDAMRFYTDSYRTLFEWLPELDNQGGFVACGALQLIDQHFPNNSALYETVNADTAKTISGVGLNQKALHFQQAGWLPVHELCRALLNDVQKLGGNLKTHHKMDTLVFNQDTQAWDLSFEQEFDNDNNNPKHYTHKTVLLASGESLTQCKLMPGPAQMPALKPTLIPARGQLTEFTRDFPLNTVVSGNQYAIPSKNVTVNSNESLWVGATFERGSNDSNCYEADDIANKNSANTLLPNLKNPITNPINQFTGVRCTTLDRLPIVGPVPDADAALMTYHDIHHGRNASQYPAPSFHSGLAVIGGLGSRGIALAPYLAELFTDWLTGGSTLQEQNRLVSPIRFLIRDLKRGSKP